MHAPDDDHHDVDRTAGGVSSLLVKITSDGKCARVLAPPHSDDEDFGSCRRRYNMKLTELEKREVKTNLLALVRPRAKILDYCCSTREES